MVHQMAWLILRCFEYREPNVLFRAFTTSVRPILEYCSPILAPVYKTVESVQRRFTKKLDGLTTCRMNTDLTPFVQIHQNSED